MKIREATEIFKSLGWHPYKDEVGYRGAYFYLPDRAVDIGYGIKKFIDEQKLITSPYICTDEFTAAYCYVKNEPDDYVPFIVPWNFPDIYAREIKEEQVHQASKAALDWAKEQDLHQGLLYWAALPTTGFGTKPTKHLASLAMLGDIEKLKFYQSSFEAGDRLGFISRISKGHIDRAVELAEQYLAKK